MTQFCEVVSGKTCHTVNQMSISKAISNICLSPHNKRIFDNESFLGTLNSFTKIVLHQQWHTCFSYF